MAEAASSDGASNDTPGSSKFKLAKYGMIQIWDPECVSDWDNVRPTEQCYLRIKRDLMSIFNDPPPGMFVVPDSEEMTKIHALITGPFDTPYEGGFFYFLIRCPPDYPIKPPRVKLMTTGEGTVRFNPNLYRNGKVCLSLLGTWPGPAWSPANTLASVLISIQSLMNEQPYHNEPGFDAERCVGDAKRYNEIIRHETMRVAVCDTLERRLKLPKELRDVAESSFSHYYQYYCKTCKDNMHFNGEPMTDPFGEKRGCFCYAALEKRLAALHELYQGSCDSSDDSDTLSDSDTEQDKGDSGDAHISSRPASYPTSTVTSTPTQQLPTHSGQNRHAQDPSNQTS